MSFLKTPTAKVGPAGSFTNSGSFANPGSFANLNPGSFIGSFNQLSGSSSSCRSQLPHKIKFSEGWGQGDTEKWYREQKQENRSTTFESLEYRKEREAPFHHEFIVVDLGNNTVCRFDRRGDINSRANVFIGEPIPSEDTAHIIAKNDKENYGAIARTSDLLFSMDFPKGKDLRTILAVCYGIQSNKATQAYTLTRYNCYFFSWMIITATARFTVDWAELAHVPTKWDELVASVMKRFARDQAEPATSGTKNKADSLGPSWFVGSPYLCNTLQTALVQTQEEIRKSLAELILHSTIEKAMHDVSIVSAQKAASQAARNHAAQAARDAALEAVIETMWRYIIDSNNDGGTLWEKKCHLAEDCVRTASAAAADVAGQSRRIILDTLDTPDTPATPAVAEPTSEPTKESTPTTNGAEIPAPPAKWEIAWDNAWDTTSGNRWNEELGTSDSQSGDRLKTSISDRAKAAWIKAWEAACKANDEYVPLIGSGVADYVIKNLPKPEEADLRYQTNDDNALKKIVKALIPTKDTDMNAQLQDWVKGRIVEHCQRVIVVTAGAQQPNKVEFENTMKSVWESTVRCLIDAPLDEAPSATGVSSTKSVATGATSEGTGEMSELTSMTSKVTLAASDATSVA